MTGSIKVTKGFFVHLKKTLLPQRRKFFVAAGVDRQTLHFHQPGGAADRSFYCYQRQFAAYTVIDDIPHNIGRSKCEPLFSTSAGDRFTVSLLGGNDKFNADRTFLILSADSLTARSASPIILNSGFESPDDSCT